MTNPHRMNRRASPEHRKSMKEIHLQMEKKNRLNRISKLRTKLAAAGKQRLAVRFLSSFGPDLDAIEAFKKGQNYEGYVGKGKNRRLKFEVTDNGKTLKLLGHTIAQNTPKGMVVSNAGFDTGLTYSSLKELGVNAKRLPNGQVQLHNKTINSTSGQKVTVPHNEVSDTPIRATNKPAQRKDPRRTVTEQSSFRQQAVDRELKEQGIKSKKGELPLSTSSIQPKDQRTINKITGVKSKIPKPARATDAHHIFSVEAQPKLRTNPSNAVMLTRKEHREVENLNRGLLRKSKLKLKLARLKSKAIVKEAMVKKSVIKNTARARGQRAHSNKAQKELEKFLKDNPPPKPKNTTLKARFDIDNGMIQLAKNQSADSIMNAFAKYKAAHPNSLGSGVYDPIENRILDARIPLDAIRLQRLFEAGTNKIGFNSITDTRQGPATDTNLIRSQLKEIEQAGGLPALGFDEGSLEALDVVTNTTDDEILTSLRDSQRSTGILDADLTFRIVDSPKFRRN